jgi:hypothetical protein
MDVVNLLKQKSGFHNLAISELPEKFKFFLSNFITGDQNTFKIERMLFENDLIAFTYINFYSEENGYENSISYLFSEEDIKKEMLSKELNKEKYHQEGFIVIGCFDIRDVILMDINSENKDQIWTWDGEYSFEKSKCFKIAENIFDFLNKCKIEIIEMNLSARNINTSQLYRNWGEDFWRVREENS